MNYTIKNINTKEKDFKGKKVNKYYIEFENEDALGVAFVGKWNSDWKKGDALELKDSQVRKDEYKGKKYLFISAPPETRGAVSYMQFKTLEDRVRKLEEEFLSKDKDDEDEIDTNDIPI